MPWKNIEEKRAYDKQYRLSHKDEIREQMRLWRQLNREHLREKAREWRRKNIEKVRPEEAKRMKEWRQKNPEKNKQNIFNRGMKIRMAIWEYKEQRGCSQCNEKDPRCLDFHHRVPEEKSYNISHGLTNKLSLETLMEEIKKCDLLCRNCHVKLNKRIYVKIKN